MINIWQRIFIEHPKSVNETYFQHMRVAGWFATRLLAAGGASDYPCADPLPVQKNRKPYDQ